MLLLRVAVAAMLIVLVLLLVVIAMVIGMTCALCVVAGFRAL